MLTRDKIAVALSVFTDLLRVNKKGHVSVDYYGSCIEVTAYYDLSDDNITIDREEIEKAYHIDGNSTIKHITTYDRDDFQILRFCFESY